MPKGWKGSLLHTGQNIVDKLDDQYDVAWNVRGKKEFNLFLCNLFVSTTRSVLYAIAFSLNTRHCDMWRIGIVNILWYCQLQFCKDSLKPSVFLILIVNILWYCQLPFCNDSLMPSVHHILSSLCWKPLSWVFMLWVDLRPFFYCNSMHLFAITLWLFN